MSKQTDDLIDRIQGGATALRGVKTKLSPRQEQPPAGDVPPAQPAPAVEQEDYDHAKQVISEMKANLEQLEATVSRDSKVPGEHPDTKSEAHLGDPKAKTKI